MPKFNAQSGNVFVFILLGVILFAALIFVFSRGLDTGATRITAAKSRTDASDIINYAQSMERAVGRMIQNGVSENDLSFENHVINGYAHTPVAVDKAQVFNTATGGGLDWSSPLAGQMENDTDNWIITGSLVITGQEDDDLSELVLTLTVPYDVCVELNKQLNTGIDLSSPEGTHTVAKYTGTFVDDPLDVIDPGAGLTSGCFSGLVRTGAQTGSYTFFKVLLAR